MRAVAVRPGVVVGQREQHEVEQVVLDQVGADAAGVLIADARQAQLAPAAGLARRVQVGVEQLLRPEDRAPEQRRGDDPRQRRLLRDLVLVAAAVDQVGGAGGAHVGVVERLEHGLDVVREVLGVHPVDGVGQRPQHPELARGREARAVLDVARLVAVVPVHARDPVLVGADAGRDRRRADRRDRRERGDAVVDVDALARGSAPAPARGRRRSRARASPASARRSRRARASWPLSHVASSPASGLAHRRIRRPAYFCSLAAAAGDQQPQQRQQHDHADRRRDDRQRREQTAATPRRSTAARRPRRVEPGAHPRQERPRRQRRRSPRRSRRRSSPARPRSAAAASAPANNSAPSASDDRGQP